MGPMNLEEFNSNDLLKYINQRSAFIAMIKYSYD